MPSPLPISDSPIGSTSSLPEGDCQIRLRVSVYDSETTYTVASSLHDAHNLRDETGFHATALTTSVCPSSTSTGSDELVCQTYTLLSTVSQIPVPTHLPIRIG